MPVKRKSNNPNIPDPQEGNSMGSGLVTAEAGPGFLLGDAMQDPYSTSWPVDQKDNTEKIRRLRNVRRHLLRRHGPEASSVVDELDKLLAWRRSLIDKGGTDK